MLISTDEIDQQFLATKSSNPEEFGIRSLMRPLGAGTFVRCSSESPLSLADGVKNALKRCHMVQPKYRVGLGSFCSGSERETLFLIGTPPKRNLRYIQYQLAMWQTNPPFRVQLTFGAGVAWSSCLSSRLPRVTRYHRYNPAVTRTSCALAKYGASDLCPELTNSIGSPLSPGQACCH
ncbi:hypothetical protein PIB30_075056 [Stylosanthes scabra]|uniref:Uncharacterized protein n=1 Tax=Stylosanthes scabra TaxID=79078 RepID=A0ABU6XMT3_9FABA|nr:hypothetical protein [Stylosanthes scabra]